MADKKINKGTGILPPFEVFDDIPLDLKDTILKNLPKLSAEGTDQPIFDDYMKSKLQIRKFEKELENAAQAEKDRLANMGVFGKMMEKLKTDANARQKFLDQIGSIGAEISRPTDPGEARGLVRDVIVGSQKGEGKTIAKRKAESEYLADVALAQQRANPMQYYTTTMKELTQQAIAEGFAPGSSAFTKYIGARLRDKGISEDAATYSETLRNLNEQLMAANASGDQKQVDVILEQISKVQNLLNVTLGGTDASSSNVVPYQPQ